MPAGGCGRTADALRSGVPPLSEAAVRNDRLPCRSRRIWNALLPAQQPRPTVMREPCPEDWFEDLTARSGIEFAFRDGNEAALYTMLEQIGGGGAMFDYDGDGDLDLFLNGGGSFSEPPVRIWRIRPSVLYRNEGDWRFTDVHRGGWSGRFGLVHARVCGWRFRPGRIRGLVRGGVSRLPSVPQFGRGPVCRGGGCFGVEPVPG